MMESALLQNLPATRLDNTAILLIEDHEQLRSTIFSALEQDGYQVTGVSNAKDAWRTIGTNFPKLIVLDLGLPDGDGLSLISEIRRQSDVPIIVISGKGAAVDKIVGLEIGADDYLAKPFTIRELTARIKAALRRYNFQADKQVRNTSPHNAPRIRFLQWTLDREKYQVYDEQNV
jgi:two-component system, OmpR family, response regulator